MSISMTLQFHFLDSQEVGSVFSRPSFLFTFGQRLLIWWFYQVNLVTVALTEQCAPLRGFPQVGHFLKLPLWHLDHPANWEPRGFNPNSHPPFPSVF